MKSTTQSQLSEQAYKDYQRETQPTDKKLGVAFMANEYFNRFGLPFRLKPNSPQKFAKICYSTIRSMGLSNWLAGQVEEAWGL